MAATASCGPTTTATNGTPGSSTTTTTSASTAQSQPADTAAGKNSAGGAKTCLALVNGTATTGFPAVVRLMAVHGQSANICSGTFISPTAVITAAHCIDTTANGGLYLVGGTTVSFAGNPIQGGTAATKAFTLGAIGDTLNPQDPTAVGKDTAIVMFPTGHAQAIVGIGTSTPPAGATVTTVGYGVTTLLDAPQDPNYDASKHSGTTDVAAQNDGTNIYVGNYTEAQSVAANGAEALNSFGDSGGPLIYNNNIVATLSNGGKDTNNQGAESYFSVFVDINSANTKALIAMANAAGAAIPTPGTTPTQPTLSTTMASGTSAAPAINNSATCAAR